MLNGFIEKMQNKPRREREKIALAATAISFAVILFIWIFSFSEMDRGAEEGPETKSLSDQMEEMKNSVKDDRQSIQEMIQGLPQETVKSSENTGTGNLENEEMPILP